MQNIMASNTMEALYEKYDRHNDLQILDSYIEYDKKTDDLKYMTYLLRKREDNGTLGDESEWKEYIKVVKLCKVFNVPRELREKKALMVSQDEFLSAIWSNQIRFITVYCNIPDNTKKVKGFYYLYGIQVIEPLEEESDIYSRFNTDEEKKVLLANYVRKKADQQYAAVIKALRGTFRQAQFLPLTRRETDAVRDVIENAKYMQAIRGLPKTHISAASGVTTSLEGVKASSRMKSSSAPCFMIPMQTSSWPSLSHIATFLLGRAVSRESLPSTNLSIREMSRTMQVFLSP